jgi:methionine-rich copper-binding protein CopC
MKSVKLLLLAAVYTLIASPLFAHTALTSAAPADGAVMREAPAALALGFTEDVQLLKLVLVDAGGEAVDINFMPSGDAYKNFNIALPALKAAAYKVSWTVLGKDGHKVEGSLGFVVDPQAAGSAGATQSHDEHSTHR